MSEVGVVVVLTVAGVVGLAVVVGEWLQPTPSLDQVITRLDRVAASVDGRRFVGSFAEVGRRYPGLMPSDAQLALLGRTPDQHVVWLLVSVGAGFVGPALGLSVLQALHLGGLGWFIPPAIALPCAVASGMAVRSAAIGRADRIAADLRYQLSAYLDVVTMLLAGDSGYEGALEHAAHAGDGRLFVELRRAIRESGARGHSLTEALRHTGAGLGLDELEQIAATAALSASEGAPVARTLSTKCATMRASIAIEQESEARLRTSKLTTPIVGMALIFMALVMYPALSLA